ncbi:PREDICTED: uncharacterized protein LOC106541971 [Thamnophis sirtalis]|uniref:Uncharacterized protein LOC106541971 n=1 Tax=Thamnophis sirtalis TaxID=35019 RepID=A0A6I9Y5D1_9SAUR|nr:PREDICTED: uncharacterized protein LOC106541971 [Thamnophis sirtalis]
MPITKHRPGLAGRPKGIGCWGDGELSKAVDEGEPAALEDLCWGPGVFSGLLGMVRGWAQSSRMQPACLFVVSVLSLASLRMSRVDASRDHLASFHPKHKKKITASPKDALKEEEEEEEEDKGFREQIVRRAVRKYPEDAEKHVEASHRQISIPTDKAEGSCPEVLAKGTLAVIVAALAFLGFFSTSVLLVVAVCILRIMDKQRKTGKEGKNGYPSSRRTLPPIPPPRPERTYMAMKPQGSDRLHPATPNTTEDAYLSVSELNPGPRTRQKLHYQNVSASSPPKAPIEKEYMTPDKVQPFSSPPSVKKYVTVEEPGPTPVTGGSPEIGTTPPGHDNHIYEQVE